MKDISPTLGNNLTYRLEAVASDLVAVKSIVESTGFFNDEELLVARELVLERLNKGEASGYHFVFAQTDKAVVGYCCFGQIPGTSASYDLYWLAVHNDWRGAGIGHRLMAMSEELIARRGGKRIYADTSSRKQYAPTRAFYLALGYRQVACLPDFYSPGDGKIIYVKVLE